MQSPQVNVPIPAEELRSMTKSLDDLFPKKMRGKVSKKPVIGYTVGAYNWPHRYAYHVGSLGWSKRPRRWYIFRTRAAAEKWLEKSLRAWRKRKPHLLAENFPIRPVVRG